MTTTKTIVAVLIVNYNGRTFLTDCLQSLTSSTYSSIEQRIFVVDNNSSDDSVAYLRQEWPMVTVIPSSKNLGYAGGNNHGWQIIQEQYPQIQYLFLLNQDTIAAPNMLEPLVTVLDHDVRVGAAQPLLLLHPDIHKVNSLGNVIHYLGFGYSSYNEIPIVKAPIRQNPINYASGAAVLLRRTAIENVGLFDDFMFMYLEDLDLGWRLMLAGWSSVIVPESIVYHKYEFSRGMKQYYYFERNRIWIVLKNYKLATIFVLMPAFIFMEVGQLAFAVMHGRIWDKLRAYVFFLSIRNWRKFAADRRKTQAIRRVSDRKCLHFFSGKIDFQPLESPVLKYIVNPFFGLYFSLIKYLIFW